LMIVVVESRDGGREMPARLPRITHFYASTVSETKSGMPLRIRSKCSGAGLDPAAGHEQRPVVAWTVCAMPAIARPKQLGGLEITMHTGLARNSKAVVAVVLELRADGR